MDAFEAAGVVHDRIRELVPHALKWMTRIMLVTTTPKQELIRLALGPDNMILKLIQKLYDNSPFDLLSPPINLDLLSSPNFVSNSGNFYDSPNNMIQSCRYFNKGYCKHGDNCRYYHGESSRSSDEFDQGFYDENSLANLELEVVHLLKSQRGCPVSIASLPMMYYDMYGRTLQTDDYLSESQRHGKAVYSLTKLLARLNSIRLIDRPHGQHDVVLVEDAPKYIDMQGEIKEHDTSVSRQIYLTFPPESTFSEKDVANYFGKFGPVVDVRIPWQKRRMFGFVTFERANTVKYILSKGCPHYVCGARILAKPYREKSKLAQRKYLEKLYPCSYYTYHTDYLPENRFYNTPYTEEYMNNFIRLSQIQLASPSYIMVPPPDDQMNAADNTNMYTIHNDGIVDDPESVVQGLNLSDKPFGTP